VFEPPRRWRPIGAPETSVAGLGGGRAERGLNVRASFFLGGRWSSPPAEGPLKTEARAEVAGGRVDRLWGGWVWDCARQWRTGSRSVARHKGGGEALGGGECVVCSSDDFARRGL